MNQLTNEEHERIQLHVEATLLQDEFQATKDAYTTVLKSLKELIATADKSIAEGKKLRTENHNDDKLHYLRKKSMSATIAKGVYLRIHEVVSKMYDKEGNELLGKLEGTLHKLEALTKDLDDGK